MRNYTLSKVIFIPFLLCLSFLAHAENSYSRVYIFGDSLSDTGNLGSVVGGIPAPYYMNRISNGPIAMDTLSAKLGDNADASLHLLGLNAGHNYAVAGATAYGEEPIDLDSQILAFQSNHTNVAPAGALYVIFIGGNDIRDALHQPDTEVAKTIIQTAINKTQQAITVLSQIGARSFLIINSPNIGLIPETRLIATATSNPAFVSYATALSQSYNKQLHRMLENFEAQKDIKVMTSDLYKLFNKIMKKAGKLGFTNSNDACFSRITFTFHPDCNYGLNADKFIFFDEIHPTTRIHEIFGEAFYDDLMHKRYEHHSQH